MKIALCLSGQPRFIEEGYNQLYEHLLSKYSIDCFIHCWWSSDMANVNMNTLGMSNPTGRSYIFKSDTIDYLNNHYKPVGFSYEPQKYFNLIHGVNFEQPNKTISIQSMWYSVKESNRLKLNYEKLHNFKYDIVIRSRTDIILNKCLLNKMTENRCVYTSTVGKNMDFPNDQFAVSDSLSSDYYSSLYDNLDLYKNEGFTTFVGERLLKYHILKSSIKLCYTSHIVNDIFKTI